MSEDLGPGGQPPEWHPGAPSGRGDPADPSWPDQVRLTAWVAGRVQGVGFRWWVRSRALELGLTGLAENLEDGRVKVVAEGTEERCRALLALLNGPGAPGIVDHVTYRWDAPKGQLAGFVEL